MAKLQLHISPNVGKIYANREETQSHHFLESIPTDMMGDRCIRSMWYDFRFCDDFTIDGISLRDKELNKERLNIIKNELRSIGCVISEIDTRTGKPWFVSTLGGHIKQCLDGVIESGIEEAKNKPHVLKADFVGSKQFSQVSMAGIEKALPFTFASVQVQMFLMDIDRAFVVVNNNDTSELYAERVKLDKEQASFFINRTSSVITAQEPPIGISEKKDSVGCSKCRFKSICHDGYMPHNNCRTCVHSTCEVEKGGWTCSKWNCEIPTSAQIDGCPSHLYNPNIITWGSVTNASDEDQWVQYTNEEGKIVTNAVDTKHGYTSNHLYNCPPELIDDENIFEIMARFDGEIVKGGDLC